MRDLGGAGEGMVESWCSISGITANKSLRDRYGWDFIFEMQSSNDIRSATGLHESNIECKVQIKTTDGEARTQKITLSNLKAMATSPLPAFYLLLEYGGGNEPTAAFLLHIDNGFTEKILKRIRQEASKNTKLDLNKKTMSLKFSADMQVHPLNGDGLKSAIQQYVGKSQGKYVEQKQGFLRTVGFDEGSHAIRFEVGGENMEQFVKMLSGRGGRVEVQKVASFETRFGLQEERLDLRSDTAVIEVGGILPDLQTEIRFRRKMTGTQFEFKADCYRGGAAAWVPDELKAVRLKAPRFQMELLLKRRSLHISFDDIYEELIEIGEHLKLHRFMDYLTDLNNSELVIKFKDSFTKGSLSGQALQGDFSKPVQLLEKIQHIKEHGNHYEPLLVAEKNFPRYWEPVNSYHRIITGKSDSISISFELDGGEVDTAVCLVTLPVVIGEICFFSLHAHTGDLEIKGGGAYTLDVKDMQLVYNGYVRIDEVLSSGVLEDLHSLAENFKSDLSVINMSQKYMLEVFEAFTSE